MKSTTVLVENIGEIIFERSKRAKRVNISVRPFKGVRVAVPYGLSFKKAEELVRTKISWILKHLQRMKQVEQIHQNQTHTGNVINRTEAKETLVKRLNELAEEYGFAYNRMVIRNQKTRWGSCSSKKNINLNVNLVSLPEELIDYVIIHELVHTRIPNHSKEFWTELEKYVRDARLVSKKLKSYRPGIL